MSYVLKQNNIELVKTLNWSPRTYGNITGTSYPAEVTHDYIWEHDNYWLGWEDDIIPAPVQPTLEQLAENVREALQSAIDLKAHSFGFSGGNALMLYAGFLNPFQPLAQVFATWEASVWVEADAYKADVIAGLKPMLTGEQAVALMPAYPV
jgi:hypothetical protein